MRDPKHFVDVIKADFNLIDVSGDWTISKRELNSFIHDPEVTGDQKEAAIFIRDHWDDLAKMATHEEIKGLNATAKSMWNYYFHDNRPDDAISRRDIDAFGAVVLKDEFDKYAQGLRSKELRWGTFEAGLGTVAAALGVVEAFRPYPAAKVVSGGMFGMAALCFSNAYGEIFNPGTDRLQDEFEKRRKMIDSWHYFEGSSSGNGPELRALPSG